MIDGIGVTALSEIGEAATPFFMECRMLFCHDYRMLLHERTFFFCELLYAFSFGYCDYAKNMVLYVCLGFFQKQTKIRREQEISKMTKQEFWQFCKKKTYIYLDGATGSNLQKAGMNPGVCPEKWILDHPQELIRLQQQFVAAGTDILYAPTFTANRIKLAEYGLEGELVEMNHRLVALSKEASKGRALVAGDLTMTGQQLAPVGTLDFEELVTVYKEQVQALYDAGVDLLVVETMMSLQETRAALIAAKETCDLPVMTTLTFEADGRTLFGTDPLTAVVVLQSLGAAAVGVNCSTGPEAMCKVIREMKKAAKVPLIAKPNAGLPVLDQTGQTCYEMDAEAFGREMVLLADAGAEILGGCCGTTPAHIAALVESTSAHCHADMTETKDDNAPYEACSSAACNSGIRYLASERQTLAFGLDDRLHVIGERINPTGKKKFQEALRKGDLSMVDDFVVQQEEAGASVLDINVGMSGVDENELFQQVLEQVSMQTSLPLCIDSSHIHVQENALRRYPGRALINSVSLEKEKFEKLLPLAKKYGAMFILLPLSDEGLPKDLEEKKRIIHTIMDRALALGMTKEDIIVDGLVATVGARKEAALETLETIRYCKSLGLATVCGLSNISFGLPERSYINAAFLTMAIANGLTMAIANPNQELLTSCMLASDLLLNKKDADITYIERMNERMERRQAEAAAAQSYAGIGIKAAAPRETGIKSAAPTDAKAAAPAQNSLSVQDKVYQAVMKGKKQDVVRLTQEALDDGISAKTLLDDALIKAINEVGELFDKGKYFLPQLIASAETMKVAIEHMEPLLLQCSDGKEKATVVVATVEGDIHDIGKNLVVLMLKNYGFRVIDLGKDVSKERIVETAIRENADIIGLSALMTTTMQQMKQVIQYAKEKGVRAKVMIGGAVITQEYADEIGADGYSTDAADAVRVAMQLVEQKI